MRTWKSWQNCAQTTTYVIIWSQKQSRNSTFNVTRSNLTLTGTSRRGKARSCFAFESFSRVHQAALVNHGLNQRACLAWIRLISCYPRPMSGCSRFDTLLWVESQIHLYLTFAALKTTRRDVLYRALWKGFSFPDCIRLAPASTLRYHLGYQAY